MSSVLEQAIAAAADLPTIPVVATRILQMVRDEDTSATELARVISMDPALAARVLKISNSSYYSCQRQIQSLNTAIMMIGFTTLRSIVVAVSVKEVYKPFGLTEKILWDHALAAALAAAHLAQATRRADREEAFLAGLFHDIGKVIMNAFDKEKFAALTAAAYNNSLDFSAVEQEFFPFTHAELGARVLKKWNIPATLIAAVEQHHLPATALAEDDPYQAGLNAITTLADLFCHRFGIGIRIPNTDLVLEESPAARFLQLSAEQLATMGEAFAADYATARDSFGH